MGRAARKPKTAAPRPYRVKPQLEATLACQCDKLAETLGWSVPHHLVKVLDVARNDNPDQVFRGRTPWIYLILSEPRATMISKGTPDRWYQGIGFVEFKRGPKAKRRPEQALIAKLKLSIVVDSLDQFRQLLVAASTQLRSQREVKEGSALQFDSGSKQRS